MTTDEERIKILITKAKEGLLSEKEKEEMLLLITTDEAHPSEEDKQKYLDELTDRLLSSLQTRFTVLGCEIKCVQEARAGNLKEAALAALEILTSQEKTNESK